MGYYSDSFRACEVLVRKHVPRILREANGTEKVRRSAKKKPRRVQSAPVVNCCEPL